MKPAVSEEAVEVGVDTTAFGTASSRRADWAAVVVALAAFAPVFGLAAAQGGYFSTSWGWVSVPFLWAAALALVVRDRLELDSLDWAFVGSIAAVTGWILLSTTWSAAPAESLSEGERALVYLAVVLAVLLWAVPASAAIVPGAALVAITLICCFSLATRLIPDRVGVHDANGIERLAQPIGYWNGLGIFAAMGALLAFGLAARARTMVVRSVCAASLLLLLPTLYFTFGRGPWIALGVGLLAMLAAGPRRLQLLAVLAATAPATALGVLLASREPALTHAGSALSRAAHEGHRLALVLLVLAVVNAAAAAAVGIAEMRIEVGPTARRVAASLAVLVAVAGCVAVFARYGSPVHLVHGAYTAFRKPPPAQTSDLNARLLNFSGNGRAQAWRVAWDDARHHLLAGDGAGSYEKYFLAHQPANVSRVRDAHSLYVETLSELGIVGLILVLGMLAVPFLALRRARRFRLAPAVIGAYAAYVVHTGVDWDWELPAVTLVGLLCGATLVLAARDGEARGLGTPARWGIGAASVAAALFAGFTLVGNTALAQSGTALSRGDITRAESDARRARTFLPWSPAPWDALGKAQARDGATQDAQASFRKAISIEPGDWQLWYDLAGATVGRERHRALARVDVLFPRSGLVAGGKAGNHP